MFKEILESYNLLNTEDKRKEINDELIYLSLLLEALCAAKKIEYRKILDDEIKELINDVETEDDNLNKIYVYVENIKEMFGALMEAEQRR